MFTIRKLIMHLAALLWRCTQL